MAATGDFAVACPVCGEGIRIRTKLEFDRGVVSADGCSVTYQVTAAPALEAIREHLDSHQAAPVSEWNEGWVTEFGGKCYQFSSERAARGFAQIVAIDPAQADGFMPMDALSAHEFRRSQP